MNFDLEHGWLDLSAIENLSNHARVDVAESNVLDQTLADKVLHRMPSLLICHTLINNDSGCSLVVLGVHVLPLWGIQLLDWHELHWDWEMDQIEIQIVNTQVGQSLPAGQLNMLWSVESVPKLGDNKEVFSLAEAIVEGSLDSLS